MKKIMGLVLIGAMLLTVFAVGASAVIPTTYTSIEGAKAEISIVNQNFDGTSDDFTSGSYGSAVLENGALTLSVDPDAAKNPHVASSAASTEQSYVVEFDVTRNDSINSIDDNVTGSYGVVFSAKRAVNADDAGISRYGVFIPLSANTTGSVYKYRITVDKDAYDAYYEANYSETNTPNTSNATRLAYGKALMKVEYLVPGATDYVTMTGGTSLGAKTDTTNCRFFFDSGAIGANYSDSGEFNLAMNMVGTAIDFSDASYTFDNIKIYVPAVEGTPVEHEMPVKGGVISTTALDEMTLTYDGTKSVSTKRMFFDDATHGDSYVMTFDACNTDVGQPLTSILASDKHKKSNVHIISTAEGEDKWYTYKLYWTDMSILVADGSFNNIMGVYKAYRKEVGTNTWEELTIGYDNEVTEDEDIVCINEFGITSNLAMFQFYCHKSAFADKAYTQGEWKIKNAQVVADNALTGMATVKNGNLVVDLYMVTTNAANAIVATYNGGVMVSVDVAEISQNGETAQLSVPYSAENADSVKVFLWSDFETCAPLFSDAIDITTLIK